MNDRIRVILRQRLESLRRAGVTELPKPRLVASAIIEAAAPTEPPRESPQPASLGLSVSVPLGPRGSDRAELLRVIQADVAKCTLCPELAPRRKQTVFGVGDPRARVVFIGEAPGADEDRLGEPFVGKAGQLLDKIIAACTFQREEVYIMNVIKCRPPENRTPTVEECENCREFFLRQLDVLDPEYIVCLGSVAAQNLLQTKQTIGRLRGKFHAWRNAKVVVTYHPSYLLRAPEEKRKTWEDMQMLLRDMGIEIPTRKG